MGALLNLLIRVGFKKPGGLVLIAGIIGAVQGVMTLQEYARVARWGRAGVAVTARSSSHAKKRKVGAFIDAFAGAVCIGAGIGTMIRSTPIIALGGPVLGIVAALVAMLFASSPKVEGFKIAFLVGGVIMAWVIGSKKGKKGTKKG